MAAGMLNVTTLSGVDPTGATDSATAINNNWTSSHPLLYFPAGKYLLNSHLTPPASTAGIGIIGDRSWTGGSGTGYKDGSGWNTGNGTLLVANFGNGSVITTPSGCINPTFQKFTLTRTSQASVGYGIDCQSTNDRCYLEDLHLMYHAVGLHMGSTGWSVAKDIVSEFNSADGFSLQGQWQLDRLFAADNTAHGFVIVSDTSAPASSGNWRNLATFGNGGYGFVALGQGSSTRLEGMRLTDCFFGGDGLDEVYLDTYNGTPHTFTNVYCETPGSGHNCWNITGNNTGGVELANCIGNSYAVLNGSKGAGTY